MARRVPVGTIFDELFAHFGPQAWWPAETPTEVIVGALLTQNTSWKNVVLAIDNLRRADLLDLQRLYKVPLSELEECLRPSGYYRLKARRLRNLVQFFIEQHDGCLESLWRFPLAEARAQLLQVNGVGPETADSILLYAGQQPTFVVDAYTRRMLLRHGWLQPPATYERMQQLFHRRLPADVALYNEYHALIVRLGYEFCRARPQCEGCPLAHRLPRGGPCEIS